MTMAVTLNSGDESQVYSNIGERLYTRPEKADVYFIFESGERVPAHKLLLSSASNVFERMFHGSLKEEGDIKIVDASAEAFKEFLRFFYFNKIVLTIENAADVMYLGIKYDVEECLVMGSNLLTTIITADNVMNILSLAIMYEQKQILKSCESEIRSNSTEILQSTCFSECDCQVLNHILQMDGLSCSVADLFKACMSWVKATSKQDILTKDIVKTHLGRLFYAIGFGSMTMTEFVNLLPLYGNIFSGEEYSEILQVISGLEIEPRLFKECRNGLLYWNEKNVVVCDRADGVLSKQVSINTDEVTKFSTNTPLLLGYFICAPLLFLFRSDLSVYRIHATILADSEETGTQFNLDYKYTHNVGFIVNLPSPILIKPEIQYEIRLSFPTAGYRMCMLLKWTVKINNGIKVEFFDDHIVNGKKYGVIHELGFNLVK